MARRIRQPSPVCSHEPRRVRRRTPLRSPVCFQEAPKGPPSSFTVVTRSMITSTHPFALKRPRRVCNRTPRPPPFPRTPYPHPFPGNLTNALSNSQVPLSSPPRLCMESNKNSTQGPREICLSLLLNPSVILSSQKSGLVHICRRAHCQWSHGRWSLCT